MRNLVRTCLTLGLTLVVTTVMGMTAQLSLSSEAEIGEAAPEFILQGTDGEEHSLKDYEGKIVVLQWINADCPVCKRCMSDGTVESMREELAEIDEDIVHLAINSSHFSTIEDSETYLEKNKIDIVALDDASGEIGKKYGARTTPHMFVIDKEGVLRYAGAIDDGASMKAGELNYVVNAVTQLVAKETVSPSETKAYGCSVKYAD